MQLTDLVKAVSSMGLSQSELELVISARNVVWQHFSFGHTMSYRRSGFNCEYLLIVNCEFFYVSQLIDSQI